MELPSSAMPKGPNLVFAQTWYQQVLHAHRMSVSSLTTEDTGVEGSDHELPCCQAMCLLLSMFALIQMHYSSVVLPMRHQAVDCPLLSCTCIDWADSCRLVFPTWGGVQWSYMPAGLCRRRVFCQW